MIRIAALYWIGNLMCLIIAFTYTVWALVPQFLLLIAQLREHYNDERLKR